MSEWISPAEVSTLTGLSEDRLKQLRYRKQGLAFYKPTGRRGKTVLYKRSEVDAFIESTRVAALTQPSK